MWGREPDTYQKAFLHIVVRNILSQDCNENSHGNLLGLISLVLFPFYQGFGQQKLFLPESPIT